MSGRAFRRAPRRRDDRGARKSWPESNTTDSTTGQGLRARVEARRAELQSAIGSESTNARTRGELENALGQVEGLLTGDLDHIPRVVAEELSTWLEASKHLDERHPRVAEDKAAPVDSTESEC